MLGSHEEEFSGERVMRCATCGTDIADTLLKRSREQSLPGYQRKYVKPIQGMPVTKNGSTYCCRECYRIRREVIPRIEFRGAPYDRTDLYGMRKYNMIHTLWQTGRGRCSKIRHAEGD